MQKFIIFAILLSVCGLIKNVHSLNCRSCSSVDDPYCATLNYPLGVTELPSEICEESVTECFIQITSEGETVRGCGPTPIECTTAECFSCDIGDNCNGNIFPENRLQCHQCLGNECLNEIQSSYPCRIYNPDSNSCFIYAENGLVTRGCLLEYSMDIQNECTDTESTLCETCTDSSCNNRELELESCYHCDSETNPDCARRPLNETDIEFCPVSIQKMGCYIFNNNGGIIKTGCVSSLLQGEISYCNQQPFDCKTCTNENNCNDKLEFTTCAVCSSETSVDCSANPTAVGTVQCRNYKDECFLHLNNDIVSRGCLAENVQFENDCIGNPNGLCEMCSDRNGCNDKAMSEYCYECDSRIDPNCQNSIDLSMGKECTKGWQLQGCYRSDDGGDVITRGCLADLDPFEGQYCTNPNNAFCKSCQGNYCNAPDFSRCRTCNSTNSIGCIRSGGSASSVVCPLYHDECYIHVVDDIVVRGCLSAMPTNTINCNNNDLCEKCDGINCNSKIVDGEFCVMCDSEVDANCIDNLNIVEMQDQCPLAVNRLGCYTYNDGGGIVKRGCNSALLQSERNRCKGNANDCKTCLEDSCNTRIGFTKCAVCSSLDDSYCYRGPELVEHRVCREYDDECILHVRDDVVTRGCRSNAPQLIQTDCVNSNSRYCEKCSNSEICNNKLIAVEFCYDCNAENDPDCEFNQNVLMRKQCQLSVRPQGCYRYDDGGGIVIRGCMAELLPSEVALCNRNQTDCKHCIGNDCNAVDFTQCITCNSLDSNGADCISSPNSMNATVCSNYLDECFVHMEDDVLSRGCLSSTTNAIRSECNTDSDLCDKCNGNNCNEQLIESEMCTVCDSEMDANCIDNLNVVEMLEQCPPAVRRLGCYTFNDGGGIVKRGCNSALLQSERNRCKGNTNDCKTCLGDSCNTRIGFTKCAVCSSLDTSYCYRGPELVDHLVCREYDDECFLHVRDDVVTRGCRSNASQLIQTDCVNSNSRYCEKCSDSEICNNKLIAVELCYACSAENDPDCENNQNVLMRKQCQLSVRPQGCFRYDDGGGMVIRGCMSELLTSEVNSCNRNTTTCKYCIGNDCNARDYQYCHQCNSLTDPNCALVATDLPTKLCTTYVDRCQTLIGTNGETIRGCSNELSQTNMCATNDQCEECAVSNCNNYIYPENRPKCSTCSGEQCNDVDDEEIAGLPCQVYRNNQQCYAYVDDNQNTHRGCFEDDQSEVDTCNELNDACAKCTSIPGSPLCNGFALITEPEYSCVKCSDSMQCAWGHQPSTATTCENNVIYPNVESCFTQQVGSVVTRGCTLDSTTACTGCTECNNTLIGCNNMNRATQFCVQCDSSISGEENCASDNPTGFDRECEYDTFYGYEQRGCYTLRQTDNVVVRGCALHYDGEIADCDDTENDKCEYCTDNVCNNQEPPVAGANSITAFTTLTLLSIIIANNIFN